MLSLYPTYEICPYPSLSPDEQLSKSFLSGGKNLFPGGYSDMVAHTGKHQVNKSHWGKYSLTHSVVKSLSIKVTSVTFVLWFYGLIVFFIACRINLLVWAALNVTAVIFWHLENKAE